MLKFAAAACALILSGAGAMAQTALPPVEAYGSLPSIESASLSPDGSKVAMLRPLNGQTVIDIVDAKTMARLKVKVPEKGLTFRAVDWSADGTHLLVTGSQTINPFKKVEVTGSFIGDRSTNARASYEYQRLFSLGIDTPTSVPLLHYTDLSFYAVGLTEYWPARSDEPGQIRMSNILDGPAGFIQTVERVDLASGVGTRVAEGQVNTEQFVVNGAGDVVARADVLQGSNEWIGFVKDGAGWRQVAREKSEFGVDPLLRSPYEDGRVAISQSRETGRNALYALDPKTGQINLVFGDARYDVSPERDPLSKEIVGARVSADVPQQHFFAPALESARLAAAAHFADGGATIDSWNKARDVFIVRGFHGASPASFYIFRPATNSLTVLDSTYPDLKAQPVGRRLSLTYKARDGVGIPAFLTLPDGAGMKGFPLVVLPHGGPASRDTSQFDWMASFLASRGYAVLQPNFRGSSGYGSQWREAGYGQWGGVMQNDLTDGVAAMVRNGIADPKRVAIVGISYGGYAALAGATITPDLYRAAISIGGIADLNLLIDRMEERSGSNSSTRDYYKATLGAAYSNRALLKPISPIENIAAIKAPILVMHSGEDTVVTVDQSKRFYAKLTAAGKSARYVELVGDDHWLSYGPTRVQMLTEIEKFLAENMK